MSRIETIIDDMEEYLSSCKPKAFSSTKIDVDKAQLEEFLEELRTKCPDEIKKCQKIISNRDRILDEAQEQAQEMINDAQKQIEKMINEHDIVAQATEIADRIVLQAQEQADQILASAQAEADEIRSGAISYTDSLLSNIESALTHTLENTQTKFAGFVNSMQNSLTQVQANRAELNEPSPEEAEA